MTSKAKPGLTNAHMRLSQGSAADVAQIKHINRLAASGSLFSTLFHINPIPTSLTRLEDGLFFDINDAYCGYFNIPRQEIIGHTSHELALPFEGMNRSAIVARVRSEGRVRNLELEIRTRDGETHSVLASLQHTQVEGDEAMLSTFIDITERVLAERQIRSLASSLTSAEQRERHRISRVLHDDLQQRLFSVKMQISFLLDAYQRGDSETVQRDSANLETWLNEAIETTRHLSIDLSPVILQGENLADAIAWLRDDMRERYGLELTLAVNGPLPRLGDDLRILLFHTVRELLFNVVKHGRINRASITLEEVSHAMRISVHDEGRGFEAERIMNDAKASHGLLELRNRLILLGCSMQIQSAPGEGTGVIIEVPLGSGGTTD